MSQWGEKVIYRDATHLEISPDGGAAYTAITIRAIAAIKVALRILIIGSYYACKEGKCYEKKERKHLLAKLILLPIVILEM